MRRNDVRSRPSPGANTAPTQALVARSSATTAAERPSQRIHAHGDSRMGARLPGPGEVADAAPADRGMRRIASHVGAVVPAALAFGIGARRDLDVHDSL